jgi:hypothetical protein
MNGGAGSRIRRVRRAVVAGLLLVAACSSGGAGAATSDAPGRLACDQFRSVAKDIEAGVPTNLAAALRTVHDQAVLSTTPGLGDASRDLLAAVQAGLASQTFKDAVGRFGSLCAGIGH